MSNLPSDLNALLSLVGERSSERRQDLLRRVAGAYAATPMAFDDRQTSVISETLSTLAREMAVDVRRTLAARIALLPTAPRALIAELANDEFSVAGPILKDSPVLSDADLLKLTKFVSQEHLGAIASRAKVSSTVSEAVAERAQDEALVVLARNPGADLSRAAFEIMAPRACRSDELARLLVHRPKIPADILNSLYFIVPTALRRIIVERTRDLDPAVVETAVRESEHRLRARTMPSARSHTYRIEADLGASPSEEDIIALAREGRVHEAAAALGRITNLLAGTAERVLADGDTMGLAVLCRACRLRLPTFTDLALARGAADNVTALANLYHQIPIETAGRIVRFWRIRQASERP